MKLGIVGLPNVGKSTLFNAITKAGAESANYPFCTIEPNVGVVAVPDERLDILSKIYKTKKVVQTAIEFYDIAGLVKGASKGEGLGNKFLGHIREAEAIIHEVRCFEDENVVHVDGKVDPVADIEIINMELIFSDMEMLERRIQRTTKNLKGDKSLAKELELLKRVYEFLESGKSVRAMELGEADEGFVKSLGLISFKPVIYVANVSEKDIAGDGENQYVKESGLDKLVKESYKLLNLISYLTAGVQECRAWTIKRGTKAPQAAGKIHSDFERGFIRAETISFDKLMECEGSMQMAKERGLVKSEGKEYVVQDGDIMNFLFNV